MGPSVLFEIHLLVWDLVLSPSAPGRGKQQHRLLCLTFSQSFKLKLWIFKLFYIFIKQVNLMDRTKFVRLDIQAVLWWEPLSESLWTTGLQIANESKN